MGMRQEEHRELCVIGPLSRQIEQDFRRRWKWLDN